MTKFLSTDFIFWIALGITAALLATLGWRYADLYRTVHAQQQQIILNTKKVSKLNSQISAREYELKQLHDELAAKTEDSNRLSIQLYATQESIVGAQSKIARDQQVIRDLIQNSKAQSTELSQFATQTDQLHDQLEDANRQRLSLCEITRQIDVHLASAQNGQGKADKATAKLLNQAKADCPPERQNRSNTANEAALNPANKPH